MAYDNHNNPALLIEWLTPVYDLFAKLFLPERKFKRELIACAGIAAGHRVLDLGAGTGTLAILLKKTQPEAHITSIDGDPKILEIARRKAISHRPGYAIDLDWH